MSSTAAIDRKKMANSPVKGYIFITHEILGAITHAEVLRAFPERDLSTDLIWCSIILEAINLGETEEVYWPAVLNEQKRCFEENVGPALKAYPDYEVVYFGLAPIPLAAHLGYLVQSFRKVRVYMRDQDSKSWHHNMALQETQADPVTKGIPSESYPAAGEVTLRIGTSFIIGDDEVQEQVETPLRSISIHAPHPGRNLFKSHEELMPYLSAFRAALDGVVSHLKEVEDIHVFAAIPIGLAFLLGQAINPNTHPTIHFYEYHRGGESFYRKAFSANLKEESHGLKLLPEHKAQCNRERERFREHLKQEGRTFSNRIEESRNEHWFSALDDVIQQAQAGFLINGWQFLPRFSWSADVLMFLDEEAMRKLSHEDPFPAGYFFSNEALYELLLKVGSSEDRLSLARMYCFQQTVHQHQRQFSSTRLAVLNRFPRVQEAGEYQADVYSLIHEFHFRGAVIENAQDHYVHLITLHIRTMWALNNGTPKASGMMVSQLNRFLIWYYLLCVIRRLPSSNLVDVLARLSVQPAIEIQLARKAYQSSLYPWVDLDKVANADVGIGVMHQGKLFLFEQGSNLMPLGKMLDGFRLADDEIICSVIDDLIARLGPD